MAKYTVVQQRKAIALADTLGDTLSPADHKAIAADYNEHGSPATLLDIVRTYLLDRAEAETVAARIAQLAEAEAVPTLADIEAGMAYDRAALARQVAPMLAEADTAMLDMANDAGIVADSMSHFDNTSNPDRAYRSAALLPDTDGWVSSLLVAHNLGNIARTDGVDRFLCDGNNGQPFRTDYTNYIAEPNEYANDVLALPVAMVDVVRHYSDGDSIVSLPATHPEAVAQAATATQPQPLPLATVAGNKSATSAKLVRATIVGSDTREVAKAVTAGKVSWSAVLAETATANGYTVVGVPFDNDRRYQRPTLTQLRSTPGVAFVATKGNVEVLVQTRLQRSGYESCDTFTVFAVGDPRPQRGLTYGYEMLDYLRGGSGAKVVRMLRTDTLHALYCAHTGHDSTLPIPTADVVADDGTVACPSWASWWQANGNRYVAEVAAEAAARIGQGQGGTGA